MGRAVGREVGGDVVIMSSRETPACGWSGQRLFAWVNRFLHSLQRKGFSPDDFQNCDNFEGEDCMLKAFSLGVMCAN